MPKLKGGGGKGAQAGSEKAQAIDQSVKHHPLFATTKEAKKKLLQPLVTQGEQVGETTTAGLKHVSKRGGRVKQRAAAKLPHLVAVAHTWLPQIPHWLAPGKVATAKILHAGLTAARAIPTGTGKVKVGRKWLIHRWQGGSLFGKRVQPRADENTMPAEAVPAYRQGFGAQAPPQLASYDRGASLLVAAKGLKKAGVQKVGIPPRGQGAWLVGEKDQQVVKRERGKTDGSSGRLKSRQYSFSQRQERSVETQDAAGQRALVSVNLNTLLRDVVAQATVAS